MQLSLRAQKVLNLLPGEGPRVLTATLYFTLLIFAFLLGRTIRDALFLSAFGMDALPWMYVGTAVSVSLFSRSYGSLAVRVDPKKLGYLAIGTFVGIFLLLRLWLNLPSLVVYSVLYLWVEIFGALGLLAFWNLAGDVFEPRQAKRVYALVTAGQVASNLFCGLVSSLLSTAWGVENLMWLVIGALLLLFPLHHKLLRYRKPSPPKALATESTLDRFDPVFRKHRNYILTIGVVVALTFIVTSMIDFQFKVAARATFSDKDRLGGFFGTFYGAVGIFGFVLQTFFSSRITRWLGVLETLAVMPAFFVVGAALQIFMPGIWASTATKFSENTLRYSLNDPVTQLLYLPLPQGLRTRALAFASGIVKPLSIGVAGMIMLALGPLLGGGNWAFSLLIILLSCAWLALLTRLKNGYLGAVASGVAEARTLTWTRPHLDPNDPLVQENLLRALATANGSGLSYALTLARRVDTPGLVETLESRLTADEPDIVNILAAIADRREPSLVPAVRALLDTGKSEVISAALRTLSALEGEEALPVIRRYLLAGDREIRLAATEGLALYCGEKGLALAMAPLDDLLVDSDTALRLGALRILELGRLPHGAQMLEPLLQDEDLEVRRAALMAWTKTVGGEALNTLVQMAREDEGIRGDACRALCLLEVPGFEALLQFLLDERAPSDLKVQALQALASAQAHEAADLLASRLAVLPAEFVLPAVNTLENYRRLYGWQLHGASRLVIEHVARGLVAEAAWWNHAVDVSQGIATELLREALREKRLAAEFHALKPFGLLFPNEAFLALLRKPVLANERKRGLLLEVLENTLSGEPARELACTLERTDASAVRALGARHRRLPASVMEIEEAIFGSGDRWLEACAVHSLVSRDERRRLETLGDSTDMIELIEKVLLLKSAKLFQNLSGADVERIAAITRERSFEPDETVFSQGDAGDSLFIIMKGEVRVHVGAAEVARLKERDCFGEMAILDDQPRSASITAIERTTCLVLHRDDFFALMEQHFEIAREVLAVLSQRLRQGLKQ